MEIPALPRFVAAGIALVVVPPLMIWTQRSLGPNVSPTVITHDDHELITVGPYRWVRHPLYLIGLLLFGSLAVLSGSWVIGLLLTVGYVFVLIRTPKEEAELHAKFGEAYEDYRRRTGRFIPRWRR